VRPVTGIEDVLVIYSQDSGIASGGEPRLILALWPDGKIVWSRDYVAGGPPYFGGAVVPHTLRNFLSRLKSDGRLGDKRLVRPRVSFESEFSTILARVEGREFRLQSDHEIQAARGSGRTSDGIVEQKSGDRHFQAVWRDILTQATGFITKNGVGIDGDLKSKHAVITWEECVR
jgi:hypothetical protein